MHRNLSGEIFRKSIHIFGFSIAFIAVAAGVIPAALFVTSLSAAYVVSERYRLKGRNVPVFSRIMNKAKRDVKGFVKEPLFLAAGVLVSLLVFPAPINYAAIAVVTLGDGFAAIVGRTYGRHQVPYTGGKTMEGTAAGAICAFAGAVIFVSPAMALVAVVAGMAAELANLRINDNITVPLLAGPSMVIAGFVL